MAHLSSVGEGEDESAGAGGEAGAYADAHAEHSSCTDQMPTLAADAVTTDASLPAGVTTSADNPDAAIVMASAAPECQCHEPSSATAHASEATAARNDGELASEPASHGAGGGRVAASCTGSCTDLTWTLLSAHHASAATHSRLHEQTAFSPRTIGATQRPASASAASRITSRILMIRPASPPSLPARPSSASTPYRQQQPHSVSRGGGNVTAGSQRLGDAMRSLAASAPIDHRPAPHLQRQAYVSSAEVHLVSSGDQHSAGAAAAEAREKIREKTPCEGYAEPYLLMLQEHRDSSLWGGDGGCSNSDAGRCSDAVSDVVACSNDGVGHGAAEAHQAEEGAQDEDPAASEAAMRAAGSIDDQLLAPQPRASQPHVWSPSASPLATPASHTPSGYSPMLARPSSGEAVPSNAGGAARSSSPFIRPHSPGQHGVEPPANSRVTSYVSELVSERAWSEHGSLSLLSHATHSTTRRSISRMGDASGEELAPRERVIPNTTHACNGAAGGGTQQQPHSDALLCVRGEAVAGQHGQHATAGEEYLAYLTARLKLEVADQLHAKYGPVAVRWTPPRKY